MQAIEIVIIVFSILFVLSVGIWAIVRKKQGKTTCGCGECDGNCAKCREAIKRAKEQAENKKAHN